MACTNLHDPKHNEDSAQGVTDVTTICLNADNYWGLI